MNWFDPSSLMDIQWTDPAVITAVIQAVTGIVTTILGALIGKHYANKKRLQEKLALAQADIAFLLAVEAAHCDLHKSTIDESYKLRIRRQVEEAGYQWSGEFTPGRLKYQAKLEESLFTMLFRRLRDSFAG